MAINVVATLTVTPGSGPAFEEAVAAARAEILANPACLRYDLQRQRRSETDYIMLESWESTDALKAHGQSEAFGRLGAQLAQLVAASPVVSVYDPIGEQVALEA